MKQLIVVLVILLTGCSTACENFDPNTGLSQADPSLQANVMVDSRLGPWKPSDRRSYISIGQSRISSEKRGDVLP